MRRSRPAYKFKSYTHPALANYAQKIRNAFDDPRFSGSPITTAAQQLLIDKYRAAIAKWGSRKNHGTTTDKQRLIKMRAATEEMIRKLSCFIDGIANGDCELIVAAGMVPTAQPAPIGVLTAPGNFRSPYSKHTKTRQTRLRWSKVNGTRVYNLYVSSDDNVANKVLVKTFTGTLAVLDSELPPGTMQWFWVSAVGTLGEGVLSAACAARVSF